MRAIYYAMMMGIVSACGGPVPAQAPPVQRAAPTMTLSVLGKSEDGSEAFSGTATGSADGAGTLTIETNKGRSCSGRFVYTTPRTGKGVFYCSDGQSGPFEFASTGMRGTGTGRIGTRPFAFTLG